MCCEGDGLSRRSVRIVVLAELRPAHGDVEAQQGDELGISIDSELPDLSPGSFQANKLLVVVLELVVARRFPAVQRDRFAVASCAFQCLPRAPCRGYRLDVTPRLPQRPRLAQSERSSTTLGATSSWAPNAAGASAAQNRAAPRIPLAVSRN